MFKQAFLASIPAAILITIYFYWPKLEFEMAAIGVLIFTNTLVVNSQNLQLILKKIGLALIGIFLVIYTSLLFIHVWGANSITLAVSLFFYQIIAAVLRSRNLCWIELNDYHAHCGCNSSDCLCNDWGESFYSLAWFFPGDSLSQCRWFCGGIRSGCCTLFR